MSEQSEKKCGETLKKIEASLRKVNIKARKLDKAIQKSMEKKIKFILPTINN